jgi:hypothetical protein
MGRGDGTNPGSAVTIILEDETTEKYRAIQLAAMSTVLDQVGYDRDIIEMLFAPQKRWKRDGYDRVERRDNHMTNTKS